VAHNYTSDKKKLLFFSLPSSEAVEKECQANCLSGTELCIGEAINEESSYIKREPTDKTQYVFCKCHKSTIVRKPGV
jgi:hypothetical protein